jgi:hypothetical protein
MKLLIIALILSSTFSPVHAQFSGQPVYAPDGAGDERFGNSVSLHGEYALIGAYYADKYKHTGAAYFFKRVNDSLIFHQKITEPEVLEFGYFGFSADLNDNYAVVGAPHLSSPGTVYIYNRSDNNWQRQSKLTSEITSGLGYSVSIDSNIVVAGAPFGDGLGASGSNQGEARIFQVFDDNGTQAWKEVATIAAGNGYENGQFGYAVDVSGNYIIAGGYPSSTFFPGRSACYVFEYENGSWIEKQRLFPNGMENTLSFGKCVSVYGETAAVGAPGEVNNDVVNGAVYIFERTGDGWMETARITSPDTNAIYEEFGRSVDLYENRVVIGSQRAAYIYEKNENGWELLDCTYRITYSSNNHYWYGSSVSIKDSVFLVGALDDNLDDVIQGAAHFYPVQKPVPSAERDALVALYNSADGPNWEGTEKWNSAFPVYQWTGVKVDNGHVIEIDLVKSGVKGHIPSEIGDLSELRILGLWNNKLSGSLPSELGNCKKLTSLYLDDNQLTGEVPASFGNLNLMQNFWIDNNQLSGDITGLFSNYPSLRYFGIGNNNFTGEVDLSKCAALKFCYMNNTNISLLNIKNGSNSTMTNSYFEATGNPRLTCIVVDDVEYSSANWLNVDSTATFVESASECLSTGVSLSNLPEINVFPNPTTGILNVTLAGVAGKIQVFNAVGQLVLEKSKVRNIDLTAVPGGVYYIRIESAEGYHATCKIIKE